MKRPKCGKEIKIRHKTPEWVVWRDEDVYYARNVDTKVTYSNTNLATMMNNLMEEME